MLMCGDTSGHMAGFYSSEEAFCVTFTPQHWGVGADLTLIHTNPHISDRSGDSRQSVSMAMQHLPHPTWLDRQRRERPPTPETCFVLGRNQRKLWLKLVWKLRRRLFQLGLTSNETGNRIWGSIGCLDATSDIRLLWAVRRQGASCIWRRKTIPPPKRIIIITFMQIITKRRSLCFCCAAGF